MIDVGVTCFCLQAFVRGVHKLVFCHRLEFLSCYSLPVELVQEVTENTLCFIGALDWGPERH